MRPFGGLSSAASSRIDLLPYQLEPALAMLRGGQLRIMIADAVGLGKTIQAGLIVRELSAERESFRALIVAPAGLRDQWAAELAERFGISAEIVTSTWLARVVREMPPDIGPWSPPGVYICSFEYIRRPEVLRAFEDTGWDLLVVDEAHAATPGSARRTAVHAIALRSRRVLLLTATPHSGDDEHFRALCRIGLSEEHPDPLLVFCRSRADVGIPARRRTIIFPVRLSESERRTHRLLERYTGCICAESHARGDQHARLAAIVLRKRALSSAESLAVSCRRRLALLTARPDAVLDEQLRLPLGEDDTVDDEEAESILGAPGLEDAARERHWLEAIIRAATDAARHESKVALLARLIGRMQEPAIVFTEYRDTLARLQRALSPLRPDVSTLHGGMTASERSLAQQTFNRAGSLLLATDAAAEGLNLHGRCRTVVHFELPWSPSRLEQRAGRVDRIGQSRTVHEIMLVADDTAERLVLAPLARRAARARSSMSRGSGLLEALSESRVASAVMDGAPLEPTTATFDPGTVLAPAEINADVRLEARRLVDLRAWSAGVDSDHSRSTTVAATVLRRTGRALPPGVIRLCTLSLAAEDGAIVHSELVVLHERVSGASPTTPKQVRSALGASASTNLVTGAAALKLFDEQINKVTESCIRATVALADRERAIALPAVSGARDLIQGGLFDRRALRAGRERARATAAILEDAGRRLEALNSRRHLTPALTLTGVLFVGHRERP